MNWYAYALCAAVLYGLHQIFTKLAAPHIGEGLGSFVVESSAAATILFYLAYLWLTGKWNQTVQAPGLVYSLLTGVCVGFGTLAFFLMFQKGGPLSAVPMILAGGAAIMAVVGMIFLGEQRSFLKIFAVVLSIVSLFLLKFSNE